jgi:hypothetical protein
MNLGRMIKTLCVLGFLGAAGIAFLLFSFYQRDMQSLTEFTTAYTAFDRSIADYSQAVFTSPSNITQSTDDLQRKAESDLQVLTTKSSVRISSAVKNEQEVMRTTAAIAELSKNELDALKTYQQEASEKGGNADSLINPYNNLKNQRLAAYAHFSGLGK